MLYTIIKVKKIMIFFLCIFCIGNSQTSYALTPSFKKNEIVETTKRQFSVQKDNTKKQVKSTKKTILKSNSTNSVTTKTKISLRKKLSLIKLVVKSKITTNKESHKPKQKKKTKIWTGQHTAGLISWASVLVSVMAFFTGHFLLGLLASGSAILFFILIFVEKDNKGTVDDILWLFSQIINIIVIIGTIFD